MQAVLLGQVPIPISFFICKMKVKVVPAQYCWDGGYMSLHIYTVSNGAQDVMAAVVIIAIIIIICLQLC